MKSIVAILRDVYAHSGYRLWALLGLMFVVGVSDGFSMALLYPVFEALGLGSSVPGSQSSVGAAFHWLFTHAGIELTLTSASLILVGAVLVQSLLLTAQNWLLLDIQKKYVAQWQEKLFSDFIAAEWSYCLTQKTGEMLNLILTEAPRLGAALFAILQLTVVAIIVCIYFVISLIVSWKLTIYLLIAGLALFALLQPIRRATRRLGEEFVPIAAGVTSVLTEMLAGAKLIKGSASADRANQLVAEHVDRLRLNTTWSAFLPTTTRSVFEFAGILVVLGALIGGLKIEQITPAQILVMTGLMARLFPRLMNLQIFHNSLDLAASAYDVLTQANARFSQYRESQRSGAMTDIDRLVPADIRAQNLTMRYGDKVVVDDIDFIIPAGQVIGFVGPSGAGKSTVVDIVIGLIAPTGGRVTVGDVELYDIDVVAWRSKIGYVSQDSFLFHDTIANNIRWSKPDASMEAVTAAARATGLDLFVSGLPNGYDTIVGDRGAKLSGGQRQRIAIARALVRQPALLVLDEATSALDSLSEQEVMAVIDGLKGKMTIVVVAHRLATMRNADIIYVIDHGSIVERGSWSSLSRDKALFHKLMQAQAISGHG